jgi:aconitate hydratase 2/2-methylisocitrate dehydratase
VLEAYRAHVAERAALGIPPLPLSKQQTTELVALLKNPPAGEEAALVELITYRVPAGVDDASRRQRIEIRAAVLPGAHAAAVARAGHRRRHRAVATRRAATRAPSRRRREAAR